MSITFLTVNVVCFWKTSISNSDSILFYKRLLLYAVPSGLDRCCTCNLIESCLTMFITTVTDMVPWPFSINHCLSLSLWRSVFEYGVQVFPCVRTLEDCAQVASPIIVPDIQIFLFFYCFNYHDSEKSKLGVFSFLFYFVTWSATAHFVVFSFLQYCVWFMVSPASFQVGCRYYISFVVYFSLSLFLSL